MRNEFHDTLASLVADLAEMCDRASTMMRSATVSLLYADAAAAQAFESARRAIIRCGYQKDGYQLPIEKYARWRQTIIDFRPQGGPSIR